MKQNEESSFASGLQELLEESDPELLSEALTGYTMPMLRVIRSGAKLTITFMQLDEENDMAPIKEYTAVLSVDTIIIDDVL